MAENETTKARLGLRRSKDVVREVEIRGEGENGRDWYEEVRSAMRDKTRISRDIELRVGSSHALTNEANITNAIHMPFTKHFYQANHVLIRYQKWRTAVQIV